MRKDFYVFRHGETELNKQKRWQGSGMDYDLNENGILQAQGLIDKLNNKGLEKIFSSPLIRAKHTAEIVAKALNIPVEVCNDLRECFYGKAEGRLIADLQKEVPEIVNNWNNPQYFNIKFEGGESKKDALNRVMDELLKLTSEDFKIAGVAIHGGTMGAMLNYLHYDFEKLPNCAVFHLVFEDGKWSIDGGVF